VKADAARAQGVNLATFSTLVLNARTRYELAKDKLSSNANDAAGAAVAALEAAKSVWLTSMGQYCPSLCTDEMRGPLAILGLPMPTDSDTDWRIEPSKRNDFVSRVLSAADLKVKVATQELE